jgi:UDP-N-acetylmuramoylalanine-D-glutamate ligase
MLRDGRPELVVAFPGGKGTAHMVKLARAAGVPVRQALELEIRRDSD